MCFPSQSLHTILRVCVYRRDGGSCNIQTSLYGIYNDNNTQSANNNVGPLIYRRPVWTLTRQLLDPFISDCNWAKAVRLYCITLTEVPAVVRETGMYFHITSLNRIELNPSWRCHEGLAERIRDLFSSPWHCRSFLSGWRLSFFFSFPLPDCSLDILFARLPAFCLLLQRRPLNLQKKLVDRGSDPAFRTRPICRLQERAGRDCEKNKKSNFSQFQIRWSPNEFKGLRKLDFL